MSDYTTHNEGVGTTGLVVAAVLIGLFVLVLAMLGTGTVPEDGAAPAPAALEETAPTAPAAPATDG
ncbi:hypothetical protein C8N43_0216 [Litoreibacter ponti]|uniref:Uncharacterized protein n=1 Tax=Litoreibacter ponti TaxID=1510457 RepID=A0A2T6BHP3_9RHOB|nr:hypothetical protein [Litoreibacter ponti]PTX55577.1 hypothetical protein C8N43_0216 [Litoreibacter ponti]